jgi:hypothetical protein
MTSELRINMSLNETEGAGKAGCPPHPRPPVRQKCTGVETTGVGGSIRPSLRNGFNGFLRALPGDHAWLPPSPARCGKHLCKLSACIGAPEPHDFAVRQNAARPARRAIACELPRPAIVSARDALASIAFRPNVRDDAYAPPIGPGWRTGNH